MLKMMKTKIYWYSVFFVTLLLFIIGLLSQNLIINIIVIILAFYLSRYGTDIILEDYNKRIENRKLILKSKQKRIESTKINGGKND